MTLSYRDRGTSGTQLDVISGSVVVCFIWKAMQSVGSRGEQWAWTFHLSARPADFDIHGSADSLAAAKAHVERDWQTWLHSAGLKQV